jgi:SnoaL-like domain
MSVRHRGLRSAAYRRWTEAPLVSTLPLGYRTLGSWVRANWLQIFTAVPDLPARVLRSAVAGDTVWTEWEMTGTRRDGAAHLMRGVIVFGVPTGGSTARIGWARFYLEVVEEGGGNADLAVAAQLGGAR